MSNNLLYLKIYILTLSCFDYKVWGSKRVGGRVARKKGFAKGRDQRRWDMGRQCNQNMRSYSPGKELIVVETAEAKKAHAAARQ